MHFCVATVTSIFNYIYPSIAEAAQARVQILKLQKDQSKEKNKRHGFSDLVAWDTWDNLVFLGESVFPRKVQQETTQRSGAPLQIPSIDEKTSSKAARDYALGASFATQETTFTSRAHVLMLLHGKFNQTTSLTYTVSSRFWKQHAIISKTVCYKQNCFCLYCTISLIKHHLHSFSRFTSLTHVAQKRSKPSRCTRGPHVPPATIHSSTLAWQILQDFAGRNSLRFGYWGPKGWRNHEKFHQTTPPMFGLCTSVCSAKEADENTHFSGLFQAASFTKK